MNAAEFALPQSQEYKLCVASETQVDVIVLVLRVVFLYLVIWYV